MSQKRFDSESTGLIATVIFSYTDIFGNNDHKIVVHICLLWTSFC